MDSERHEVGGQDGSRGGGRTQDAAYAADYAEVLFDLLPDVVFFLKDTEGRYTSVNQTLAQRCGFRDKARLIGRTAVDIFPAPLGAAYLEQDLAVIRSGTAIDNQFELHLYPDRRAGWCLTRKVPLRDGEGRVVALAGISRDLGLPDKSNPDYRRVAGIADRIRRDFARDLSLARLASEAGLSLARLERHFRRVFGITPRQMLLQARLDAARAELVASPQRTISAIALDCGYTDHSAFSRQFKAATGMTPAAYRQLAG